MKHNGIAWKYAPWIDFYKRLLLSRSKRADMNITLDRLMSHPRPPQSSRAWTSLKKATAKQCCLDLRSGLWCMMKNCSECAPNPERYEVHILCQTQTIRVVNIPNTQIYTHICVYVCYIQTIRRYISACTTYHPFQHWFYRVKPIVPHNVSVCGRNGL